MKTDDYKARMPVDALREITGTAGAIENRIKYLKRLDGDTAGELAIVCAGLAIKALDAQDTIDSVRIPLEDRLRWNEISAALKQIAFHALAFQDGQEADGSGAVDARIAHLEWIIRHAGTAARLAGIEATDLQEPEAETAEPEKPETRLTLPAEGAREEAVPVAWAGEDQISRLKKDIARLREQLAALVLEKEQLEKVECRRLLATYMTALGTLLAEQTDAEIELRRIRRMINLAQAEKNRGQQPDFGTIERQLDEEYRGYQERRAELYRKIQEAAALKIKQQAQAEEEKEERAGDSPAGEDERRGPEYIKKLFRQIVKAMHPDLHPEQGERERELFRRAIEAYENGDTETLEMICSMTESGNFDEPDESELEALLREKARLMELTAVIRQQIESIKSCFPYTQKDLLENPERLRAKQEEIRRNTEGLKEAARKAREELERIRNG